MAKSWQTLKAEAEAQSLLRMAHLRALREQGVKAEPKPARPVEPDQFGRYMEEERVQEAALSEDPTEINQFDVGETFARPASLIR